MLAQLLRGAAVAVRRRATRGRAPRPRGGAMGCGASRVQPDQAVLIAEAAAAEAAAAERAAPEKTVVEKAAAEFERQLAMARAAQEAPTNAALRFGQQFELTTPMLVMPFGVFKAQGRIIAPK